jgi:para-nitrobenzyl esterase
MVKDRAAAKSRAAAMAPAEMARYLRAKTAPELLAAAAAGNFAGMLDMPVVFRDGTVLPRENLFDVLGQSGRYNEVPIVLGTNRDENKLFLFTNPWFVRRWFGIFPVVRDPKAYELDAEYGAKMWKAGGADEVAMRLRRVPGQRVWVYRFDWDEEPKILGTDLGKLLGASHAFEIPFEFGHFEMGREANAIWTKANEPGRLALSAAMMSYWAQFAYAGDPASGRRADLPAWRAWGAEGEPTYVVLDTPGGGGIRMNTDFLTKESVVAQIEADPRLPTEREKCERLRELALWSGHFTKDEYATACRNDPIEAYTRR